MARAAPALLTLGLVGCFVDAPVATTEGASTTGAEETTTTTTTSESVGPATATITITITEATTDPPPPSCGDGVVDPGEACDDGNQIDEDACRSDCQPATCGDGIVHAGVEACDDGAQNDAKSPTACRPDCQRPACGDGAIYAGAFAPPINYGFGTTAPVVSRYTRRAATIDAQGRVSAALSWADGAVHGVLRQVDGDGSPIAGPVDVFQAPQGGELEVDAAPDGRLLVAYTAQVNDFDVFVRRYSATLVPEAPAIVGSTSTIGAQLAPTVAVATSGDGILVFGASGGVDPAQRRVRARRLPAAGAPPPDFVVGDGQGAETEGMAVDLRDDGTVVVAYTTKAGSVFVHHLGADDQPIASVLAEGLVAATADLRPGVGVVALADGSFAVAGPAADDHLHLQRYDARGGLVSDVQVSSAALGTIPRIDLGADAAGNVAALWGGCGAPGSDEACDGQAGVLRFRWVYADGVVHGEKEEEIAAWEAWEVRENGVDVNGRGDVVVVYQDVVPQLRIAVAECP